MMSYGTEYGELYGSGYALDIAELAASRVYTQFRQSPNILSAVEFIAECFQELEELTFDLRWFRGMKVASGVQLDEWGELYNLPRGGKSDPIYKIHLLGQHAALFRQRTPELFLQLLAALDDGSDVEWSYREEYPAAVRIELVNIVPEFATAWDATLRRAKKYGVRLSVHAVDELGLVMDDITDPLASAGILDDVTTPIHGAGTLAVIYEG